MELVVRRTPGGYFVWRMSRVRWRALTKGLPGVLVWFSSFHSDLVWFEWISMWTLTVVRRLSGGLAKVARYTFGAGSVTVTFPVSPMGTSKRVCSAIVL